MLEQKQSKLSQHDVSQNTGQRSSSATAERSIDFERSMMEIDAEFRSHRNKVYRFFYKIIMSVTFNFLIYCFILANTITLAMYRFDQSD